MILNKKMTAKRGVTIPKKLAAELGYFGGETVDISETTDGGIVIHKHTPTCRFCGDKEHAKNYKGIDCCPTCAAELLKGVS